MIHPPSTIVALRGTGHRATRSTVHGRRTDGVSVFTILILSCLASLAFAFWGLEKKLKKQKHLTAQSPQVFVRTGPPATGTAGPCERLAREPARARGTARHTGGGLAGLRLRSGPAGARRAADRRHRHRQPRAGQARPRGHATPHHRLVTAWLLASMAPEEDATIVAANETPNRSLPTT